MHHQGYFCLDYFSIDAHDMDGNYWQDAGDNGNSNAYGGNFLIDWQNSHALGEDYYYNRSSPGGSVTYGAHNTQHIYGKPQGLCHVVDIGKDSRMEWK
ncbi:MAG: hypothetical protein HC906_17055 [Bacteroidales bacterium]|nr:hypothetical protein [Bacteroidales bacterium]